MIPALTGAEAGGLSRSLGHRGIYGGHVDHPGRQNISKIRQLRDCLSNAERSALKLYTNNKNSLSGLYLCRAVHTQC